jgi:hypothetical protein
MMAELPTYSGLGVTCPECGVPYVVATVHHAAGRFIGEHVCRICHVCGYSWPERGVSHARRP